MTLQRGVSTCISAHLPNYATSDPILKQAQREANHTITMIYYITGAEV
jgi:hypothetical protein